LTGSGLTGPRPTTPAALARGLAERLLDVAPDGWVRVAVDGAAAASPDGLADGVAEELRAHGRAVLRVSAGDFLRPASVRLEHGREDPDAYYQDWLDVAALHREVLAPLGPQGSGLALPRLWNPATDRSYRAGRVPLPRPGVLLLDGPLLLGHGLPFELTVHLTLGAAALRRRTDPMQAWTLPAFERYETQVRPAEVADVVVRCDDPLRPAVTFSRAAAG
jgi:hypothetical protein